MVLKVIVCILVIVIGCVFVFWKNCFLQFCLYVGVRALDGLSRSGIIFLLKFFLKKLFLYIKFEKIGG